MQMISVGTVTDIKEAREIIYRSFDVTIYIPQEMDSSLKTAALAEFARLQIV
ncbi:hypothetical protein D3C78_1629990 [compost metagenome]